mmetsp:Transcript_64402/g.199401  ORF Transcript_64402/g.199401 Transcript_64402/m.199401 type:complete len:282 (-) Transcript_64402:31-876(-)
MVARGQQPAGPLGPGQRIAPLPVQRVAHGAAHPPHVAVPVDPGRELEALRVGRRAPLPELLQERLGEVRLAGHSASPRCRLIVTSGRLPALPLQAPAILQQGQRSLPSTALFAGADRHAELRGPRWLAPAPHLLKPLEGTLPVLAHPKHVVVVPVHCGLLQLPAANQPCGPLAFRIIYRNLVERYPEEFPALALQPPVQTVASLVRALRWQWGRAVCLRLGRVQHAGPVSVRDNLKVLGVASQADVHVQRAPPLRCGVALHLLEVPVIPATDDEEPRVAGS